MSHKSFIAVLQLPFFSVAFQSVANSESRFIVIDTDAYGKQSDSGTFSGYNLYQFLADSESTLPKSASFEGSGTDMPFVILGNKAYPLKTFLMRPLARKNMSCEERGFNCRLLQARICVECDFWCNKSKMPIVEQSIRNERQKS
jgi:hypothetical protein